MIFADIVSLNGIEGGSVSSFQSFRDGVGANHRVSTDPMQKPIIYEAARSSDGNAIEVNEAVFLDDISSVDASSNRDEGILDNCGILPNNCLPCLASTVPSFEKRRSSCSSPPSSRKKTPTKVSSLCEFEFLTQHSFILGCCNYSP